MEDVKEKSGDEKGERNREIEVFRSIVFWGIGGREIRR
jgi:hypothetical protein